MLIGIEYGGGVQNLKIAVAEVSKTAGRLPTTRVPELCSIRNVIYEPASIKIRKAVRYLTDLFEPLVAMLKRGKFWL